ncbi:hypothetical protein HAX54_015787 [Datura stramonium]|uniref:Uncharacterized protein n=1 Tax=Datura stramonium TaxID=4076 RepID=A0ABS8UHT5_DATST|nr:hypothetical protein [Datura stramonium]
MPCPIALEYAYIIGPALSLHFHSSQENTVFALFLIAILIQVFAEAVSINNAEDTAAQACQSDTVLTLPVYRQAMKEILTKNFTTKRIHHGYVCARRCKKSSRKKAAQGHARHVVQDAKDQEMRLAPKDTKPRCEHRRAQITQSAEMIIALRRSDMMRNQN